MKRQIIKYRFVRFLVIALAIASITSSMQTHAENYWPSGISVESQAAIVMELETGTILFSKNDIILDNIQYLKIREDTPWNSNG